MSTVSRGAESADTLLEQCCVTCRVDVADFVKMYSDDIHRVHGSCRRGLAHEASKAA